MSVSTKALGSKSSKEGDPKNTGNTSQKEMYCNPDECPGRPECQGDGNCYYMLHAG